MLAESLAPVRPSEQLHHVVSPVPHCLVWFSAYGAAGRSEGEVLPRRACTEGCTPRWVRKARRESRRGWLWLPWEFHEANRTKKPWFGLRGFHFTGEVTSFHYTPTSQVKSSQVKSSQVTAGLRSTFDRLPYGCLLFMYRLDLTTHQHAKLSDSARYAMSTVRVNDMRYGKCTCAAAVQLAALALMSSFQSARALASRVPTSPITSSRY